MPPAVGRESEHILRLHNKVYRRHADKFDAFYGPGIKRQRITGRVISRDGCISEARRVLIQLERRCVSCTRRRHVWSCMGYVSTLTTL